MKSILRLAGLSALILFVAGTMVYADQLRSTLLCLGWNPLEKVSYAGGEKGINFAILIQ